MKCGGHVPTWLSRTNQERLKPWMVTWVQDMWPAIQKLADLSQKALADMGDAEANNAVQLKKVATGSEAGQSGQKETLTARDKILRRVAANMEAEPTNPR